MLRFKLFSGTGSEVQQEVNRWLQEYNPEITHMTQTVQGDGIVVSFLFDESFRGQEIRLAEERGVGSATNPAVPAETIPDRPIVVPEEPGHLTTEAH